MGSSNESDKPLETHPEDNDGSSRSSSSGNSIEGEEQVDTSTEEILEQPPPKISVIVASTSSSNISTEEDLNGREDATRKSTEDISISSVRINNDNPFNATKMDENVPPCPEENGKNQPALAEFDDDAASNVSDRSSFRVPASPFSDITANLTPYSLSPMQSPPSQAMDRSAAKHYRIPSAVFAMASSPPIEWSLASNESLFSLHVGNNSFTKDRVVVANSDTPESCEPRKSIELATTSEGLPSDDSIANMERIFQENNKPIDILEDLSNRCEKEPRKELSLGVTWNSTSCSECPSAPSFSIPAKKRRSSKSGPRWIREVFCCHIMKCASPSCGCCSNCSPTCSCCDNCSGKRLCSILLCGLPEVAKCCNLKKTQHPKASKKSNSDDCFSCSCSSCRSCCTCPSCSSCSSCCTCPSCKYCCSWPCCNSCCSCRSSFSYSCCQSCCSCRSCSFPSCKSCCYCASCSSCCTFPSCKSCCTFPSINSCCSCNSCRSCCSFPSCHSCCYSTSCTTYSCQSCKFC